ncbi:unnamed protein product [Arabidopsis halleri]
MFEDRLVLVKKWVAEFSSRSGKTCCDIAISSMVSGHKNFLKLLGCCLEFPYPVLVYEYAYQKMDDNIKDTLLDNFLQRLHFFLLHPWSMEACKKQRKLHEEACLW